MTLPRPIPARILLFWSYPAKCKLIDKKRILRRMPIPTEIADLVTLQISDIISF